MDRRRELPREVCEQVAEWLDCSVEAVVRFWERGEGGSELIGIVWTYYQCFLEWMDLAGMLKAHIALSEGLGARDDDR